MLFSSIVFLFYFLPVVFVVYYLLTFSRTAQNVWLLIVSLIFYAWGEPVNVLLMIAAIFMNWLFGILVSNSHNNSSVKKIWMIIACVYNIGILFVFKYLGFFLSNINMLAGDNVIDVPSIALPIGISFYTFQALSYVIDVYRGDIEVEKNPFFVGLYISFFPQLIAGPIVKFKSIAEQIRTRRGTLIKMAVGTSRFVVGLSKKILLANNLAIVADLIFNWSELGAGRMDTSVGMAWIGAISYTLQIYFDFSGYSDMAIGLGLMFGFKFEENFNYPYIATSINDFWKRWHISLTTWFREYVYIPLGGNRGENRDTMIRNLFIVWLLTGIWHGSAWNFLFWGMWHFIFQLAERFFGYDKNNNHPVLMRIYTILVVVLGWVLFRAKDLYQAGVYLKNMFWCNSNSLWNERTTFIFKEYWVVILVAIVFCMPIAPRINQFLWDGKLKKSGKLLSVVYPLLLMLAFVVCTSYLVRGGYNPFIYFDF